MKKESLGSYPKYIYTKHELATLNKEHDSVLGLFSFDHMPYHLEAEDDDPTLSEMTQKAIEILSRKKNGYVLFVEGYYFFYITFFFDILS